MMMKKNALKFKVIVITLLLSVFSITNSCKKSTTDVPGVNEVFIQGMAFTPSTITVAAGTTITWTNKDGVPHTVTSNSGLFDSNSIGQNGTYSHLFSTAGSFPYHCTIHPAMTATVNVN
jgi:plastocyanin